MLPLLTTLLLSTTTATAQTDATARAEYIRLSEELHRLASRDAWAGVERFYEAIQDIELPASFADHLAGAHAASAKGDVAAARERLLAAHRVAEHRDVLDWLWSIDHDYGPVRIELGTSAALQSDQRPFQPHKIAALTHAASVLGETGSFEGLLPTGVYNVAGHAFTVEPGRTATVVDSAPLPRRRRR